LEHISDIVILIYFFSESDLVNVVTTLDYQLNYWTEEQFGKKKSESWRIVFILRISIDFFFVNDLLWSMFLTK
jgi:hypothetical protein